MCCLFAASCSRGVASESDFNVILISLDTLRADHLGLYGYHRETSPNLDRIGAEGVVFERAFSQAPSTTPSHRSLMTSQFPSLARRDHETLAQALRRAGFATAGFTGGGRISAELGFDAGFDTYFEATRGKGTFSQTYPSFASWLSEPRDRPFFVFLHSYDIHYPYLAPEAFERRFLPGESGPDTGARIREVLKTMRRARGPWDKPREVVMPDSDRDMIVALYDGGISYADSFLGELRRLLEAKGLWDRTLLVVLSDHGEEFWEHSSALHSHTLYQELLHVPLVLRIPGGRFGGQRRPEPVQLIDVAPTILDLLNVPAPAGFRGKSLLPLMSGGVRTPQGQVMVSEMATMTALYDWPMKFISGRNDSTVRIFDLENDPGEQNDLFENDPFEGARQYSAAVERAPELGLQVLDEPEDLVPEDEQMQEQLRVLGYIE